jgi:uncharacterized protein with FMN-binding domain
MKGKTKSALGVALVLTLGCALVACSTEKNTTAEAMTGVVANTTSAAYRDGLYQGRRTATAGKKAVIVTTHWSSAEDLDSFRAGYLEGYSHVSRSQAKPVSADNAAGE